MAASTTSVPLAPDQYGAADPNYTGIGGINPGTPFTSTTGAYQGPGPDQVGSPYASVADAQNAADIYNNANNPNYNDFGAEQQAQLSQYLASGDFSDAWKYAAGFGNATAADTVVDDSGQDGGPGAHLYGISDPNKAFGDLINPTQLQTLDPNYNWTQQSEDDFFNAGKAYDSAQYLGTPDFDNYISDTQWGDPSKLTQDANTNYAAGYIPNFSQYAAQETPESLGSKVGDITFNDVVPALLIAAGAAATGGAAGSALGGGLAGGIGGGAVGGATGATLGDVIGDRPLTLGSVGEGALTGAVTGGLGYEAQPLTGALTQAGLDPTLANGLVKGGIGAGVGALSGAISPSQTVAGGALQGGANGLVSGLVGGATGNPTLGQLSGTIAGAGASTLLPGQTPSVSVPTTTPGSTPSTATSLSALPTDPNATGTTNIGSYSGYGYQPRQQVQNPVSDYATYGQGPEANFFQNVGAPVQPNTATANTQPLPTGSPPAVSNTQPIPISIPTLRQ